MCPCVLVCVHPDDNKALWGINIMKKAKKTGSPKAFGVRLEDCQPAVNHKVSLQCFMINSMIQGMKTTLILLLLTRAICRQNDNSSSHR